MSDIMKHEAARWRGQNLVEEIVRQLQIYFETMQTKFDAYSVFRFFM